ncbi:MAG TPA: phosphatase PAP2 family protein, partial [Byssovorax sp.]
MLQLIVGTGEIRPQQISPDFKTSSLLAIDRPAVTQTIDPHAGMYSSIGLYAAVGYAVLDPILTGVRENSAKSALVDATIYGEASAMTTALTNIAKMAVRRPRPIAYIDFEKNIKTNPNYTNSDTDSALSFFSGHAAECGTITAVASYLAFARSPHSARPWVTLLVGTALTSFVSVERVRSGEHFTTDVIAGSFTGAGIGVLTAHLHRVDKVPPLWVGWQRANYGDGGALTLNGVL